MPVQRHVIKRQILQVGVPRAQDAHTLSAEMSRVYRQRILPLIDRYCTELSAPDRLHRIELLEVDLGTVDAHNLEEEVIAKVSPALRQALAARIRAQEQADASSDRAPITRSQLELLAYFARTGSLPWWADRAQPTLLDACLQHLLAKAPDALHRLLKQFTQEPHSLRRIIRQFNDEQLARLAGLLVPQLEATCVRDATTWLMLLQASQVALSSSRVQVRYGFWHTVLSVAGISGWHYGTQESWYRAVLKRVAVKMGVLYDALVADIQRLVQADGANVSPAFKALWDGVMRHHSHETSGVVDASDEQVSHSLGLRLTPAKQVEPQEKQELTSRAPSAPDLDSHFSDADELSIDNAGLVVLWPFLSHFFAHVGLLEEKHFKDAAAQQRAVGLLQYLATGDASFLEYLLPLNKVLCGMEVTEVFDFGAPLAEAETEECGNLLHAVIAQVPILRNMTPTGFRGSFLLRRGMLSTRDGAWLLRVKRETYDVVLDRFPWTIQWVKLPWMEAPLRVEW
mgnify:CR=1 FL=1